VKYYYNESVIYSEFSASLFQSSVLHNPSEIIIICRFAAQETFVLLNLFSGYVDG